MRSLVDKNKLKIYMLKIKSKPRKHYYDCIILAVNHDIFHLNLLQKPKKILEPRSLFYLI